MTDEQLTIANDINERIENLDREIYLIMDIEPPVRSANKFFSKFARGNGHKLDKRSLIPHNRPTTIIELSNEDCRALIDIRTAEREALKQVLNNIK